MNNTLKIPTFVWRLLFAAALVALFLMTEARAGEANRDCVSQTHGTTAQAGSWIFSQSRYTHDPDTGGRVAQYAMKPPVEPLPDPRAITSGYRRTRTVLRGADGSADTSYQVQSYGNGRGGLDAQSERLHDAQRGLGVGRVNLQPFPQFGFGGFGGYGFGGPGFGGYPPYLGQPGFPTGQPGFRFDPRQQYGPGFGRPDAGLLDPDAADGYHDGRRRTPDRRFFNQAVPTP